MKNLITKMLLFLFAAMYPCTFAQVDTLTILHLNDTHSCLAPLAPRAANLQGTRGGIARAASVIGEAKLTEPNVLVLHGGDSFIGDLFFNRFFGAAEFKILNAIGLDAMAVGNHEFDLTPAVLDTALKLSFSEGGFPLLSANLNLEDEGVKNLKEYIKPYTIKQLGNVKVGIFGMTTPETMFLSLPSPAVIDTSSEALMQCVADVVTTLKTDNCNVIICLSHLGLEIDKMLAAYIPGINLIVGAHDHYLLTQPVELTDPEGNTTLIVQAGAFYSNIGKLKLAVRKNSVSKIEYNMLDLNSSIPEEPSVKETVDTLIAQIEAVYGQLYTGQIGTASGDLEEVADISSTSTFDTPVGNLVTEAFLWKTNTDIAIEAGGSTAQKLYHGPIVPADVFRMLGYGFNEANGLGFRLVKFNITGADLLAGLEAAVSQVTINDELLPQVSGMKYSINLSKPAGEKISNILINNLPLDPLKTYSATANEFFIMVITGPPFSIPVSNIYVYPDSTEFQVVTEYIASKGTIIPDDYKKGSITEIKKGDKVIPEKYYLEQNYPNPFNPSTTIEFRTAHSGKVSLKVYGILGNEIAVLVNGDLPEGKYRYQWTAGKLASGVYIYTLKAGGFQESKKLILLK